jgi:hypothetical protein
MFDRIFGKKPAKQTAMVTVQLNAKLQPMHRGEFFEDPLDERLKAETLGEVSGGGTMLEESGEVQYCDIVISLVEATDEAIGQLAAALESLGAPKGSKLRVESSGVERTIGNAEGIAVYLNGTDLPDSTYESCDSNFVYSELERLLLGKGRVLSYWQGPTETAFYMYGNSFREMNESIAGLLASYPLCEKCRVVQLA